ncbi:thiol reductase thioredoxin [Solibacillus sp. R5-41]|uniref:thioredoxin family protein n=1 Tax=Solibacillus sp. R5-41 TaxID=2048654 RepID=UPI000C128C83|nr:thioredoxin family protein [Solibacillus sp. R5-41]ATP41587.1 thiol reductase thioredoxin [Solibacillus sp. R5-41]
MEVWTREQWVQQLQNEGQRAFYLYTPMCGTCDVASKILTVIEELLPDLSIGMANINYLGDLAMELQVESVPCLIIANNGEMQKKIYAFQSVPFLYEMLKSD